MKEAHKATEEEFLQEVIDELKDAYEMEMRTITDPNRKEDMEIKLKVFVEKVKTKAGKFLPAAHRYRHLCSVTHFMYGLVMASRVQSHYTHAPWFKLGTLGDMLDVYGTVSNPPGLTRRWIRSGVALM